MLYTLNILYKLMTKFIFSNISKKLNIQYTNASTTNTPFDTATL